MLSYRFKTPGVYTEETSPPPRAEFRTGVPAFLGYTNGDFPISEDCSNRIFSLPMHPYLEKADQDRIIEEINKNC